MLISDRIAGLILAMLKERGGTLEIQRNDMAERIGCSPSQINYVIESRFSPEHGYIVESRRGGGGYVRIVQKSFRSGKEQLMHTFASIGNEITQRDALVLLRALRDSEAIGDEAMTVMHAALSAPSLAELSETLYGQRCIAEIFRRMLLSLS